MKKIWIMKKILCQGSTSFFMVLSLLPVCVQNVIKPLQFCPERIKTRELQQKYSAPHTNKGNNQKPSKTIDPPWISIRLFGLPSNESSCQVLKTTRNCIEVDDFSPHLKQINTRKIRIHPNKKEWTNTTHVWNHHKKNFGNKDFISCYNNII